MPSAARRKSKAHLLICQKKEKSRLLVSYQPAFHFGVLVELRSRTAELPY